MKADGKMGSLASHLHLEKEGDLSLLIATVEKTLPFF